MPLVQQKYGRTVKFKPWRIFKTIDNIQNTKSLDAFSKTWSLIPAKGFYDSLEIRLNNAFPGDKIPVNDFKQQLAKQEKYIKTAGEKINGFIDGIVKKTVTICLWKNTLKK